LGEAEKAALEAQAKRQGCTLEEEAIRILAEEFTRLARAQSGEKDEPAAHSESGYPP
jgi:hypothetical protein